MKLATAETEIEKNLSLGNYYVSYFRILNTLGIEHLHKATVAELKKLGFNGFLMGENFMKEQNPGIALKNFVEEVKKCL